MTEQATTEGTKWEHSQKRSKHREHVIDLFESLANEAEPLQEAVDLDWMDVPLVPCFSVHIGIIRNPNVGYPGPAFRMFFSEPGYESGTLRFWRIRITPGTNPVTNWKRAMQILDEHHGHFDYGAFELRRIVKINQSGLEVTWGGNSGLPEAD